MYSMGQSNLQLISAQNLKNMVSDITPRKWNSKIKVFSYTY